MKKALLLIAVLLIAAPAGAVDVSSVFGSGVSTCAFAASKPSIQANGSDSTTLTLAVNGAAYTSPVNITETGSGQSRAGVTIPSGGLTITASAPGTWNLQISNLNGCPTVMIQAH